jgi:enoyl-CoA hydratase/carnithine racemase
MPGQTTRTRPTPVNPADIILREEREGFARLVLNRPNQRNALSMEMLERLGEALAEASADDGVRAIVIAANGPGFCAGHDLKEMAAHRADADGGRAYYEALFARCSDLMLAIAQSPKVIVAEVQGTATAAGCQLVAACDLAIASSTARFGVNGIDAGLFCSTPMVALSRNIGRKKAMELLTLGRLMSAEEAHALGLVNEVVEPAELRAAADAVARTLAAKSRAVLALGKKAFYDQLALPLEDAYRLTSRVIVDNMMMADAAEGICAFIDRRKPRWRDA